MDQVDNKMNGDRVKFLDNIRWMNIDQLLLEIESINGGLSRLTGSTRERARQDRDDMVRRLAEVAKSNWHSRVRLTIMDSNAAFHREDIVFRNADGSLATTDDVCTGAHILVMPERETYSARDVDLLPGLVKLDQEGIDWMPIISERKFLILRFATGRMFLISTSLGIRAMAAPEYVDTARAGY
jgi:hypothetical protein